MPDDTPPRPIVMLPTYNEAENIRAMVQAVLAADPALHVLVVDDDSPDGTARLAEEAARESGRVHVMVRRERRGRGYAGVEGFRRCIEMGCDPIIEMDADFSHDPAHLPELLAACRDVDVVIGSRGVAGGGAFGRSLFRRFVTWGAWVFLRLMLGVPRVKDPTSGYRCFRRRVLEAIRLDTLQSPGPSLVTEILFRCRRLRIRETPIRFRDRRLGRSKFNTNAMTDSILLAMRLRLAALFGRDPAVRPGAYRW
jgi:dolichol-phosphate mannosyltransferase